MFSYAKSQKINFVSDDQAQAFQLSGVFRAGGQKIDAGGFDRAVPQQVGQLDNILIGPIEGGGEQMPQVVREYLRRFYLRLAAQIFHLRPNLPSGQIFSASGEEDPARGDFLLVGIF